MYQFLCIDANMPPPYLEVHWRGDNNESFEEMDMDDMFNKEEADFEDPDMAEDFEDDEQEWEGDGNKQRKQSPQQSTTVFNAPPKVPQSKKVTNSNRVNKKQMTSSSDAADEDVLEIQSLSVVEAEFIYSKIDGDSVSTMTHGDSAVKRTINLEAFKIIRVIGKGGSQLLLRLTNL